MSIEKKHLGNITWIDLVSPTTRDIRGLVDEHRIPPSLGDEIVSPSLRPHTKSIVDTFFISLKIPVLTQKDNEDHISNQEIDLLINPDSLITTHYTGLDVLDNFSKFFETRSILNKSHHLSGTRLCSDLLIYIYKSIHDQLDQYRDSLRTCEEQIFDGSEKEMVRELSRIQQQLLRYDEALRFHDDILHDFHSFHMEQGREEDVLLVEKIRGEYERVTHGLENNMSYLHELRDTNNSLLSINQNNTMQLLTVMAYTSLPASIIASIFGMNARNMPLIGHQFDFWILLGAMVLMSLSLFLFFKIKKWL
jgi:magnesium transporter